MSAGTQRFAAIDIAESAADLPTEAGVTRLRRNGGILQKGELGGAFTPVGVPAPAMQVMGDSDATIALGDSKAVYVFPPGTLTQARTITISNAGAVVAWQATIAVLGAQGFNLVIKDGAAATIHTIAAGEKKAFNSYHNGTQAVAGFWYWLS